MPQKDGVHVNETSSSLREGPRQDYEVALGRLSMPGHCKALVRAWRAGVEAIPGP